jgi:hypothetical protein
MIRLMISTDACTPHLVKQIVVLFTRFVMMYIHYYVHYCTPPHSHLHFFSFFLLLFTEQDILDCIIEFPRYALLNV